MENKKENNLIFLIPRQRYIDIFCYLFTGFLLCGFYLFYIKNIDKM